MVELNEMSREELLGVIAMKDCTIRELKEEVEILKSIISSKLTEEDFNK